ncbi:MAG: pilus assembly protein PilM, partial [Candidatus Eisenbacteria bacterium]|nr:pilus assembly protein PilM [Candidatus Eisenbacteria bacterium]
MSWFKRGGNIPKGTRWLGLEVGHSAVKGAILSKKHGKVCLDQFLFEELPGPKDPNRDGQLTSALAALNLSQYGGIRTALVLEGRQVDVHLIRLPRAIPKKEREQAALLESLSRMSLNPEDAIQAALEQGEVGDEVVMLVAAASKTGLERYLEAVRRAGVEPDLITIGPVVLGAVPGRDSKKSTVVFNIGSQSTSMAVFHQDNLQHAREARVGSDPITDELAEMLGDDRSMGESIKRFWRLPKQGETSIPVDMNGEKFSIDPMSLGSLQQLCDELRRSVRFIRERERIPVDEVLLTGGGSLIAGLSEYLNFPKPVECKTANSLDGIEIDETKVHRPLLESIAPRMSQAIGAARLGLESPP